MSTTIARYRSLKGTGRWVFILLTVVGVALCIVFTFNVNIAGRIIMEPAYLGMLLALLLPPVFLLFPATKGSPRDRVPWYDALLALLSIPGPVFVFLSWGEMQRTGIAMSPPMPVVVLGVITWAVLLEGSRRTAGLAFFTIVSILSVYPLFSGYMPGFLVAKNYDFPRLVGTHLLGSDSIFGLPWKMTGEIVLAYLIFAAVVQLSGAGKSMMNLALAAFGGLRGGGAKVSVLGSAMFGMISGSAVSNVITVGAMTIPLMKRTGYPASYAGAVEAVSSTGGVLTPPVMGTAAFIMAGLLGVPYYTVCIAAALPAFAYYAAVYFQTDLYACKVGIRGAPKAELLGLGRAIKEAWYFILPVCVLVFFLFVLQEDPGKAALYTTATMLLLAMIRKETRLGPKGFVRLIEEMGKLFAELVPILAACGMIIGSVNLTGVGMSLAAQLGSIGGGNLLLMLALAAVISFILGTGLTMAVCYILVVVVLGQALINAGVYPLAAHLFICYWGMMSYLTPPVALAVFAAAPLAKASTWSVGKIAVRLGIVGYLMPFAFVYQPALLLHGEPLVILRALGLTLVGILCLCCALEGYSYWVKQLNIVTRLLLGAAGCLFFGGDIQRVLVGVYITAAALGGQFVWRQLRHRAAQSRHRDY